jgi:murein DD-endopeptidase MepM/ murein hydrolase activator NlpD
MIKVFRPVAWKFPISSPFGFRTDPETKQKSYHYGIDFAVPVGTPVVAAVNGKVDAAGWQDEKQPRVGFGLRVRQLWNVSGKEYFVYYGHLSELCVAPGQDIAAGTRIGLSGDTGKNYGAHLHFEVRLIGYKGVPVEFYEGDI